MHSAEYEFGFSRSAVLSVRVSFFAKSMVQIMRSIIHNVECRMHSAELGVRIFTFCIWHSAVMKDISEPPLRRQTVFSLFHNIGIFFKRTEPDGRATACESGSVRKVRASQGEDNG